MEQVERSLAIADFVAECGAEPKGLPKTIIEVGSGAGLLGIPAAIRFAQIWPFPRPSFMMIEPKRKAAAFLEKVVRELDLDCTVVAQRAEKAGRGQLKFKGDFILAKALTRPALALQLCAPLCNPGGTIVLTARSGAVAVEEASINSVLSHLRLGPQCSRVLEARAGVTQRILIFTKRKGSD